MFKADQLIEDTAPPVETTKGLVFQRHFMQSGVHPFDTVKWVKRDALITDAKTGEIVFKQDQVEFPDFWSQTAINIVAQKYFRGKLGTPQREYSLKQMILRVVDTITNHGLKENYFYTDNAAVFHSELCYLLLHQYVSFNTPVWFNIGIKNNPQQASACFILDVQDDIESIFNWFVEEGNIFKSGSGSGINISKLRAENEWLSGGGRASGPLSFMQVADKNAGVIKSGSKARRAAKMVEMNIDHPDIEKFIWCKVQEDEKAKILKSAGYSDDIDGEIYRTVSYQNENHSVSISDEFVRRLRGETSTTKFSTIYRTTRECAKTYETADLFRQIAEAAWRCGDPGAQFPDTMNAWHTCPHGGMIEGSNPCSEYNFLNNTACFAPETRISTPYGLCTVEDLYLRQEDGEEILVTTDIHSECDHRRLTAHRKAFVTRVGQRPVVLVTLKDGRSIRVTSDHRFLTEMGWKRIDEMVCGKDRIHVRESGNPVTFSSTEEEKLRWQMLGWFSGDGIFSKGVAGLVYGPEEKSTANLFEPEFNKLVKDGATLCYGDSEVRECHTYVADNGVMQITSQARSTVSYLEQKYGFTQGTALHKDVPSSIYEVEEDLRVAYLQGLFSADGCIRESSSGTEPEVMLASSSPEMLRSIQLLLSDLGIVSRITWMHPTGRKNPQGQLHIYNQQMRKFISIIGMPLSEKKFKKVNTIKNSVFGGAFKNPRPVTVVSMEDDGIETVYDVTEPDTNSLIVEGMIAHNCNLASHNLIKYCKEDGSFDVYGFCYASDILITAQEILVGYADYPTQKITENSHKYRTLGLGYNNLGGLLMVKGFPYDSDEGRNYAASITALMTGEAYKQSARIAKVMGAFEGFVENRDSMLNVIHKHLDAIPLKNHGPLPDADIWMLANNTWVEAENMGWQYGYRNAQVTLLQPGGTVSFMMDCATTGIEPEVALVNYKKLSGGGTIKRVNPLVHQVLQTLGYDDLSMTYIVNEVLEGKDICNFIKKEYFPIFDCAFPMRPGGRSISWEAHIKMVAAVQPFLSGSASKTINMPNDSTVEDVERAYMMAWELGLKSISIYRDGCKFQQPVTTQQTDSVNSALLSIDAFRQGEIVGFQTAIKSGVVSPEASANFATLASQLVTQPQRKRLPDERPSLTHKFALNGAEGYLTIGLYENGQPGELFLKMAKEGSTISGLVDAFATCVSIMLQYGVPLKAIVDKFSHTRFEPAGFTQNKEIPTASSVIDYVVRYIASKFLKSETTPVAVHTQTLASPTTVEYNRDTMPVSTYSMDAPVCSECGSLCQQSGSCWTCIVCGSSTGCG